MKGTWGRRVFGTVTKGPTYTRFRLEFALSNGVSIYEVEQVPNGILKDYPDYYKYVLDLLLEKLAARVAERL